MSIQNPTATERRIVLMPIDALAAEIDALRAEVESWAQQADDRAKDAVRFAQERDEANADNARLREALQMIEWSNDSKWQADCARAALAAKEGA